GHPRLRHNRLSFFFFSSRRRHTSFSRDWSSDVCSSDLSSQPSVSRSLVQRAPAYSTRLSPYSSACATHQVAISQPRLRLVTAVRSEERRVGKGWRRPRLE